MKLIFAKEEIDVTNAASIFLAGPTPRNNETFSWRIKAVTILDNLHFDGVVLIPEDREGVFHGDYDGQIEWEEEGLIKSSCIMFWVPRSFPDMPAFTTNDEWGHWKTSGKVTWGAPHWAEKVKYQWHYANKLGVPTATTLEDSCKNAIQLAHKISEMK